MTFKELLNQCSWEDLEDFLYEFPDVGMDEGRWKMEGFRRMYDELRGMTPRATKEKIRLQKDEIEGCEFSALFTRPTLNLPSGRWPEYLGLEAQEKHGRRKGDDEEEEVILDEDWSIEIQRLESEQPIDQRLIEKCLWVHSPVSVDEVETAKQHCVASIKLSSRTKKSRAERLKKAIDLLDGTLAPYERCVVSMDTNPEHPATIEEQQAAETAIRGIMPHNPQIKWHFHMEKSIYAGKAMNVRIIASKND